MNIKFKQAQPWSRLENTIPGTKESLRLIVTTLNQNKLSAYVNKNSKSQYQLVVNNQKQIVIRVCKNNGKSFLHLDFYNGTKSVCIFDIDTLNTTLQTWLSSLNENKNKRVQYIRNGIYSIEEVLSKRNFLSHRKEDMVEFDGDMIFMNSDRYHTFAEKGLKCVCCGIEGKYFVKERNIDGEKYHFNLYAVNKNGEEVLMTKDHIIPKSKGGKDEISNYQTMCTKCNGQKGNKEQ
jgi:5-methylcytosine-specific restriction endonuclease McrA